MRRKEESCPTSKRMVCNKFLDARCRATLEEYRDCINDGGVKAEVKVTEENEEDVQATE